MESTCNSHAYWEEAFENNQAAPRQIHVTIPSTSICPGSFLTHITEEDWVRLDLPRCGGFLQFKGLSGGLPRWRAAYDEALNRTLSQSGKPNESLKNNTADFTRHMWQVT